MDLLEIRGLKVEAVIGHHAWEREVRQALRIDLLLGVDAATAAAGDRLADALDYQAVADAVAAFAGASRYTLIETLAERLAAKLQQDFGVTWLRVTVHKPGALKGAEDVAVTIERGRR